MDFIIAPLRVTISTMESSPWEVFDFVKPYIPQRARKPLGLLVGLLVVGSYLATAVKALARLLAVAEPLVSPLFWSLLLNAVLVPAIAILGWFLWRARSKEAKAESPSSEKGPRDFPASYVGPPIKYDGVEWTPILHFWGDVRDTIQIGDPGCPDCQTPLQFFGDWKGHCPNASCKKTFTFSRPVASTKEAARLDAIGRSRRGELIFPGKDDFKPLAPKAPSEKLKTTLWWKFLSYQGVRWKIIIDLKGAKATCRAEGPLCEKCETALSYVTNRAAFVSGRTFGYECPRPGCGFSAEWFPGKSTPDEAQRIALADFQKSTDGFQQIPNT